MNKTEAFVVALIVGVLVLLAMWWTLPRVKSGQKVLLKRASSLANDRAARIRAAGKGEGGYADYAGRLTTDAEATPYEEKMNATPGEIPRLMGYSRGGSFVIIKDEFDFEERQVVLIDNGTRLIPYAVYSDNARYLVLEKIKFIPKKGQWKGTVKP